MSKPDAPKTPESEKMQAKIASEMFNKGSAVKARMGGAHLGDQRRDNRSARRSMASAGNALAQKNRLIAQRRAKKKSIADESAIRGGAEMLVASGKGGKSRREAQRKISSDVRSVARTGSIMSEMGNQDSMRKFVRSNQRKQAMADAVQAGVSAYAYRDTDPKTTKNDFAGTNTEHYIGLDENLDNYVENGFGPMYS